MRDKTLLNKRILFIAPDFFGYELFIRNKMEELGAKVDFYHESAVKSSYLKALKKVHPQLLFAVNRRYYKKILDDTKDYVYDYVLFIKCESISTNMLKKMRSLFRGSVFILYLYDSMANIKGIRRKLPFFDRILTFDRNDAAKNPGFFFRPNFYADEYRLQSTIDQGLNRNLYDLCFIGTIHSDRYAIIRRLAADCEEKGLRFIQYCYLQNRMMFYLYKLSKKEFFHAKIGDFQFEKLGNEKVKEIVSRSRIVLDTQHPRQTGLTMRLIETIGMQKKVVTANEEVRNYDFFDPQNVCVIDRKNIQIPDDFLSSDYMPVDPEIYGRYSLSQWVGDVFFHEPRIESFLDKGTD